MKNLVLRSLVLVFASALPLFSVATAQAQSPRVKGPVVQCLTHASFLQKKGTTDTEMLESTIPLKLSTNKDLKGVTTIALGNDVSIHVEAIVDPSGSNRKKGVEWLVLRTRMFRTDASGKVTVLDTMTSDSDDSDSGLKLISAKAHHENPEIETAQVNNADAKIDDLVQLGLLPASTVWYSMLNCVYFKD